MQKLSVGGNVDSWCTRCKLVLAHTIEAVAGGKITRVHCNTCKSQHAYRARPPSERPARASSSSRRPTSRARRTSAGGPTPLQASDYDGVMRGKDLSRARPYRTDQRFAAADVINHPTFGMGLVLQSKDGSKIEVLFPDGPKVLVHGR